MKNITSFRKRLNTLPGSIKSVATSMTGLAAAGAGLVGVASIGHEIQKSFSNIDNLAKTSDKLGIATEKLTALRFAAEENGVAAGTTDMALQRMVRRIAEAAQGSGEAVGALNELGLSAQSLANMSPDQQFAAIAESMKGVTNQGDRVRLAMKLFDSEGVSLVNTLRLGKDGLAAYEQEAAKLGLTVSRIDAAQIEAANDAFGRIGKAVEGITNKIAIALAPIVESVSKQLTEWGTSGELSAQKISDGVRGIAKAVGFVRDGIEFWVRAFKSVRAYVSEFFAWIARKTQQAAQAIADLLNKIPGVETAPLEFTNAFADEREAAAKKARAAADAAWAKPLPSEGIDKFFRDIDAKLAKARADAAKVAATQDSGFGGNLNVATKVGSLLKGGVSSLNNLVSATGRGAGNIAKGIEDVVKRAEDFSMNQRRDNPGVLDARSSEGFAQLRSSMMTRGTPEKQLEVEKKQEQGINQMVGLLGDLVRKTGTQKILGFNDA